MPLPMPRPRTLEDMLTNLITGGTATQTTPGGLQVVTLQALVGGLTTAGSNLSPNTANSATYLALGTGTQAFGVGLTSLAAEVCRVPVIASALTGLNQLVAGYVGAGAGAGWWTEAGVYGGAATAAANSGTLYAYVLLRLPFLKNQNKACVVNWVAT